MLNSIASLVRLAWVANKRICFVKVEHYNLKLVTIRPREVASRRKYSGLAAQANSI